MKLYESKITKDPTEFAVQISKTQNNIDIINEKIYKKVNEVREEYGSRNPEGIIKKNAEEKFLELVEEINNLDERNENAIIELETTSFRKIEELKEFYEVVQKDIIEKCNKELILLSDESEIPYSILEPNFTAEDFENMKNESKENANETRYREEGITFKKTHYYSKYSTTKHFKILKENILDRIENIKSGVINDLVDFVNNISKKYIEELSRSAKREKQKLQKLQDEKKEVEDIKKKIVELEDLIKNIALFKKKYKNIGKEIEEYV